MPLATAKPKLARLQLLTARFRSAIGNPVIDSEAGTIKGCRIATLGAISKSKEGEGNGLLMDSETISALFKLAKDSGDRIPAMFTHAWYESDADALNHDAGVWNNFSISTEGNLTADFTAFDTPYKSGIFSRAKADPNGIAVSPLFHFVSRNGSKTLCTPTEFVSSDFVKSGAINRALFSETTEQPTDDMTDADFIAKLTAALKDSTFKTALLEAIKPEKSEEKKEEKKGGEFDAAKFRADLTAEFETKKTALLAEVDTKAQAAATALLGKGGYVQSGGDAKKDEVEAKLGAYVAAGAANRGVAIMRFAHDKPEEYNAARAAGKL